MGKSKWTDCELIIGLPDLPEDECIKIPIHGEQETNQERKIDNAFQNAMRLLDDSKKVSMESCMILCALSCELFIKAIIWKTQGKRAWGHDIHELFFKLSRKEQDYLLDKFIFRHIKDDEEINDIKINQVIDNFEDMLSVDALIFETVRYKHEYSALVFYEGFIYNLAVDLKELGCSLGFSP